MKAEILYNGKRFPEYIFNKRDLTCLFFEFDIIFDEEFWSIFKPFAEEIRVDTILVDRTTNKTYSISGSAILQAYQAYEKWYQKLKKEGLVRIIEKSFFNG